MKSYMTAMSLWEVIETLNQIKKHDEEMSTKSKALSFIHSAMSEEIFATIMSVKLLKKHGKNLRMSLRAINKPN